MTTIIGSEGKALLRKPFVWLIHPIPKELSTWALHGPGSLSLTYSNPRYGHHHTSETQMQGGFLPEEDLAKSLVYIPTVRHVTQTQKHSEVQQSRNKVQHIESNTCKETKRLAGKQVKGEL